ncbi:hypothetical protein DFH29DRAFT_1078284 [Suillus ampliporus]|nr:hypothetical protein DFH29DRAFT_1078284 [Suillus ampliporus]
MDIVKCPQLFFLESRSETRAGFYSNETMLTTSLSFLSMSHPQFSDALIAMLPFAIGTTYGVYFLSTVLCAMLWGVSCIQTFSYFTRYHVRDDRWLKVMVAVIFTTNSAQTALIVHGAYAYLVLHFGNFSFFRVVLPVSSAGFLLSTIVCVCVQGIFVVKAYQLSETRSRVLPSLWVPLGLFELGAALYCVVKSFQSGNLSVFFTASLKGVVVSYLAVMSFLDIAIAFCLTKSLCKLHRQAMTFATSEMIQRLIIFSVLSGFWTALFALLDMITYLGFPNTAVYVVFDLPLCSLYCNTLLVSLNSRDCGSAASIRELSTFKAASRPVAISMEEGQESDISKDRMFLDE